MKIWLEISNSPHINLFSQMIDEGRSHEIIVTARNGCTCTPLARIASSSMAVG
jgi:predicted glycosyltransferase